MKYKLNLNIAGVDYKSGGETIDEALASLNLTWNQIKAKGVLKVTQGKHTLEHLFYLKPLKRIFANKTTRFIWAKRLELLIKQKDE